MKRSILLSIVFCICLSSQAMAETSQARKFLDKIFSNDVEARKNLPQALLALRATKDPDLLTIFQAIGKCNDKNIRRLAPSAIMSLAGDSAARHLLVMLNDPTPEIQAEVVVYLANLDADNETFRKYLVETLNAKDENLQCLAARSLVKLGQTDHVKAVLEKLTASADQATSSMAAAALLAMGDKTHMGMITKLFNDKKTDISVLALLLEEFRDLKITAAREMVATLADNKDADISIRLGAYRTLVEIDRGASAILAEAIEKAPDPLPIFLLGLLSKQPDAITHLKTVTDAKEPLSSLIEFELARLGNEADLSDKIWAAMKSGHPVVIAYITSRGETDLDEHPDRAGYYVKPLLAYLVARQEADEIAANERVPIERACTLLVDIGSKESMSGAKYFFNTKYGPFLQAVTAGLMKSKNKAAGRLAIPLLDNPYTDVATYATFTAGKFSLKEATENLTDMITHPDRHRPSVLTFAAWYLLKIEGTSTQIAKDIAATIK